MKRFALLNVFSLLFAASLVGCGNGDEPPQIPETADGSVNYVIENLAQNKPEAVWDAMLPASYQQDVTKLVHDFAGKLDAEMYDKSMETLAKAAKLLTDKKEFFLNSQMLAQMPADDKAALSANWDTIVGMLDAVANSEIKSLDGLKTVDIRKFLKGTGSKVMAGMQNLPDSPLKDLAQMKAEIVETTEDGVVSLKITRGEATVETEDFTQVEGRWIPVEMSEDWEEAMTEARARIDSLTPEVMQAQKVQVMSVLATVNAVLDQLAAAKTQAEFDQTVAGLMNMMGGMIPGMF